MIQKLSSSENEGMFRDRNYVSASVHGNENEHLIITHNLGLGLSYNGIK